MKIQNVAEMTTSFATTRRVTSMRTYKNVDVVNALTAQSAKLAVADNFSMVEANKAAESAMFQCGMTARNVTEAIAYSGRVIDTWTKLAHNGGASAQDLSQGVERAGSAAHQTGTDFEFLSAQIATGVRATGRSGAEIGNMLKTLYGSIHSKDAIAQLDALGISVYKIGEDGSKQFRKAQDVLLDLAVTAQGSKQSMEEVYKSISGGKFQWSKAGATLGDYKEFIRTWGQAVNSMGFTDKQVGMQLDTISRRIGTLKADLVSMNVSAGRNGLVTVLKGTITSVDRFVVGLKQIPAWTIEAAVGLGVAAKAFWVLRGAIVATNVASMASRATPLGAALTVLSIAAVAATEAMGGLANAERDAAAKATDHIAVAQQQMQQMEQQAEFADALISSHQRLQAQIESSTEGTEVHTKALENQKETEKQLTSVLGQAAVDRIKDSNWSVEAYNKEKQAFIQGVNEKKQGLVTMITNRLNALETEREVIQTAIQNYWKDTDSFAESIKEKAKYLSWWQQLWARFNNARAESFQGQADDLRAQARSAGEDLMNYQGDMQDPMGQQLALQYRNYADMADAAQDRADKAKQEVKDTFTEGAQQLYDDLQKNEDEYIAKRQQLSSLVDVPKGLPLAPVDTTSGSGTGGTNGSSRNIICCRYCRRIHGTCWS